MGSAKAMGAMGSGTQHFSLSPLRRLADCRRGATFKALALLGLALTLSGCPSCPDGELHLVAGTLPAAPGATVSLELRYDDYVAGPTRCRGHWYVDGVEGGDATVGSIDHCGLYTAPDALPPTPVRVEASQYALGQCADCCPWATRTITFATP